VSFDVRQIVQGRRDIERGEEHKKGEGNRTRREENMEVES
jgi:hypothetical protein